MHEGPQASVVEAAAAADDESDVPRRGVLRACFVALRPRQWIKNLFVFAPLLFAKHLFDGALILRALAAFGVFTALASAIYVLNDLFDVQKDREHPYKRLRPIASGELPLGLARAMIVGLTLVGAAGAFALGWPFAVIAVGYVVLNVAYTLTLKHWAFVDVLCIAMGFLLRVVGGSVAIDVAISKWLLICTFLLALFLGLGKRKHEYVALHLQGGAARKVMEQYRLEHLNVALWVAGLCTLASYAAYTFDPDTALRFGTQLLPLTILFIGFGIFRFVRLIDLHDAESPTEEMLKDVPFVVNTFLWVAAVIALIYQGAGGQLS